MSESSLPMNTVLDGPERDPLLDDETAAILKAVYLKQPQVLAFRAHGMSDAEIVNTMHDMAQAGLPRSLRGMKRPASCRPNHLPAWLPAATEGKGKTASAAALFRR